MASERGQATVEWIALLLVVVAVLSVGAIASDASWLPARLRCAILAERCRVATASAALRAGPLTQPPRRHRPLNRGDHRPYRPRPGVLRPHPRGHRPLNRGDHRPHALALAVAFVPGRRWGPARAGPRPGRAAAGRGPRAVAASLSNWIPAAHFKSDLTPRQASGVARQLRDRSLQLAVAGVLIGVGGAKLFAEKILRKITAELLGGLSELGALDLNKLANRISDAVSDAKPGQRICVHVGLKGPSILGLPGVPIPIAGVDLTAWPRKGRHC